jgi:enterochelin esterase family protein
VDGLELSPVIRPCTDDTVLVTFRWRGEASSTALYWGLDAPLRRQPGTDRWETTLELPADLTTVYCLTHDGSQEIPRDAGGTGEAHLDPANPDRLYFPADPSDPSDYDAWASVLTLPAAPPDRWSAPRESVPSGPVTTHVLPDGRVVDVYRPAGVEPAGLPAMVVFDAHPSREVLRVPQTLDNLIAAGRVPPMAALFYHTPEDSRDAELSPTSATTEALVSSVLPWARSTFGLSADPALTTVAGSSRGALMAAAVGLQAPAEFGGVLSQSGSFWWPAPDEGEPEWLTREFASRPRTGLRFYLDVGNRETMPGPGGAESQLTVNRRMRDVLRDRGYPVTYAEYTGGHDYINWRRTFADGVLALYG